MNTKVLAAICLVFLPFFAVNSKNNTNPHHFGIKQKKSLLSKNGGTKAQRLFAELSKMTTAPPDEQQRFIDKHIAYATYTKRLERAKKILRLEFSMKSLEKKGFAAGVSALIHAICYFTLNPTTRHYINKAGIAIAGLSAPYVIQRLLSEKKTVIEEINSINMVFQLDDQHLLEYIDSIQTSLDLVKAGLPDPFFDTKKRLHIPADAHNAIAMVQRVPIKQQEKRVMLARETLKELMVKRVTRLKKVYSILEPLSAFLTATLLISITNYPATHAAYTRKQIQGTNAKKDTKALSQKPVHLSHTVHSA